MKEQERFYTLQEVAEQLRLSEETVRRYIKSGKLPALLIGGRYRITHTELQKFLRASKKQTSD